MEKWDERGAMKVEKRNVPVRWIVGENNVCQFGHVKHDDDGRKDVKHVTKRNWRYKRTRMQVWNSR